MTTPPPSYTTYWDVTRVWRRPGQSQSSAWLIEMAPIAGSGTMAAALKEMKLSSACGRSHALLVEARL